MSGSRNMAPRGSGWNPDAVVNVLGETRFVDDLPEPRDLLHGAVVVSRSAHGRIARIDASAALALDPSVLVLTARDIPGENQLGTVMPDEPLLVEDIWSYRGQVLALVLAGDRRIARKAAALVRIEGEDLPPVLDPREAAAKGLLILAPRTMKAGDPAAGFRESAHVIEGRADSGGQEHLYLETQAAVAWPGDAGGVRIVSGTQSPTGVQHAVARVLGVPMNRVDVEAMRIGGAFGGKEEQAAPWAALAALGARVSRRPVKLALDRHEDLRFTGKRHPYSTDYRIGLDADGRILAFEADYYQNSGACTDLSPGVISRTLFHALSAYSVPNVRVTGRMCRTNLPPFTAFRGFGGPQAVFVIESALARAAEVTGIPVIELQRRNLLRTGDTFHYGMPVVECRTERSVDRVLAASRWPRLREEIAAFNANHEHEKRGAAMLPICFGISFTRLMMNQGGALVHVYHDGSVGISTGAVEMGQGVGRKIALVAARTLGIPVERIRIEPTRTTTVANTQPTAASTGSDINGMATRIACTAIRKRLLVLAACCPEETDGFDIRDGKVTRDGVPVGPDWESLVTKAYEARVDLSAHGFYSSPGLFYDEENESGSPFVYHVYGAAVVSATADTLRGTYRIDDAFIVHDAGEPIDLLVDRGQAEGGFVQGLGWAVLEDLRYDGAGKLLSDTLSTYKIPDIHFVPRMEIEFLEGAANPKAVLGSKGIGEPPLLYGIAAYFAVLDALRAARPDTPGFHDLPMTPEKALRFLAR